MNDSIYLKTTDGKTLSLTLPERGVDNRFFVICTEYSGHDQFWMLLERLAVSGRQAVWKLDGILRQHGLTLGSLTQATRQEIFCLQGYGLGIFFDPHTMIRDAVAGGEHSVFFVRDPRDVICTMYLQGARKPQAEPGFKEFLASSRVVNLKERYRRLAELWSRHPHTVLFRYEDALHGWSSIAAGIVAFLNLQIAAELVSAIAAEIPPVGNRMPWQVDAVTPGSVYDDLPISADAMDALERECADILTPLGFERRQKLPWSAEQLRATPLAQGSSSGSRKVGYVPPKLDIFEPDPATFTRLRANSAASMRVLGRHVMMDVDASGCRPVVGQPELADRTLSCFGCSFTYGIAVTAEETFCSRLQWLMPDWRVENHGVSSHGTAQNLLLLQRHLRWNKPDYVAFCWIPQHQLRNVADITWVQNMSRFMPSAPGGRRSKFPRAALDGTGALVWRASTMPRTDLQEADWTDFGTEPFYQDLVCFRIFEAANALVRSCGGKFFAVTLWGQLSSVLSGWLLHVGIDVVNSGVSGDEYRCLPDDPHANAAVHEIYANRIAAYLNRGPGETAAREPTFPSDSCDPAWPIGARP